MHQFLVRVVSWVLECNFTGIGRLTDRVRIPQPPRASHRAFEPPPSAPEKSRLRQPMAEFRQQRHVRFSASLTGPSRQPEEHAATTSISATSTQRTAGQALEASAAPAPTIKGAVRAPGRRWPLRRPVQLTRTRRPTGPRSPLSFTIASQTLGTFRHWPWPAVCFVAHYDATVCFVANYDATRR